MIKNNDVMKRLFFVLIFVFAGLSVKATGQMADYVFVDGEVSSWQTNSGGHDAVLWCVGKFSRGIL